MTVQKKILDLTGSQYLVQKVKSAINDVGSSLSTHIADTDIHVTTADKTKWNNGVTQSYVFRYSSTALVASSTNSNTLLDNTDNLKVGDKVIDSSGVIYSVTAIDTANSTFTIGTALIDLAQDSDVVHKSGNETVGGIKTFSDNLLIYNSDNSVDAPRLNIKTSKYVKGDTTNTDTMRINFLDASGNSVASVYANKNTSGSQYLSFQIYTTDNNNANITSSINYYISKSGDKYFLPYEDNQILLGGTVRRWKSVYATNYYYGANNVEFSTKFVTTDTAQTITGQKSFSSNMLIYNSDNTATTPNLYLRSSKIEISSQGNTSGDQNLTYLDKNNTTYAYVKGAIQSNGSAVKIRTIAKDSSDNSVVNELQILAYTNGNKAIFPSYSNEIDLGISSYKWKSFNGLEPSSLSLPSVNANDVIDISSYITDLTGVNINSYTPSANGYIVITCDSNDVDYIKMSNNLDFVSVVDNTNNQFTSGILGVWQPCIAGLGIQIRIKSSALRTAKFIPCQGNV